eukprot:CAMPEP_0172305106 /NCGR_PEP_ID=MMETSP1058-20130122/6439_1 /TAXON_ID=83371 /ORGANISM="Detonula confervacea, Strain CCMP 353" /LENGTH=75 /DNA_ID=CAMNT_0013016581 /DNA_START=79 /DNA_END=302 /DNA_ORIENTATION=+
MMKFAKFTLLSACALVAATNDVSAQKIQLTPQLRSALQSDEVAESGTPQNSPSDFELENYARVGSSKSDKSSSNR